jgi:hypothetical protein
MGPRLNPTLVPTVPVMLDPLHPLAQSPQMVYVPGSAHSTDLAGRQPITQYSASGPTAAIIVTASGPALLVNGNNIQVPFVSAGNLAFNPITCTVGLWFANVGLAQQQTIVSNTNGAQSFQLYLDVSGKLNVDVVTSSPLSQWTLTAAKTISNNVFYDICATYNGSAIHLYINGVEDANSPLAITSGTGGLRADPTTYFCIGDSVTSGLPDPAGAQAYLLGTIRDVGLFSSIYTASQAAWHAAEPFAMLRPIVRRTYSVPAATGAYTGSISDSAASSTSQSGVMVSAGSVADTAATSDSFTETAAFTGSVTDTVASSDSLTGLPSGSNMTSAGTFGDTAASSDNFSATSAFTGSVTDTAASSDSFTGLAAGAYTGSLSDTAASSDVFSALAAFTASIADTTATAGNFTGSVPGAYTGGLSDAAVTSDAYSSVAAFVASMADSAVTSGVFAKPSSGSGNFFFGM